MEIEANEMFWTKLVNVLKETFSKKEEEVVDEPHVIEPTNVDLEENNPEPAPEPVSEPSEPVSEPENQQFKPEKKESPVACIPLPDIKTEKYFVTQPPITQ